MDQLPYVHGSLTIEESPLKGRLVRTTAPIKRGEPVLIDAPNALVPAMLADKPPYMLCSRHGCYRRIPRISKSTAAETQVPILLCRKKCLPEVAWCSEACMSRDASRHALECLWLKETSRQVCNSYGDGEFVLIWLMVRLLIVRYLDDGHDEDGSNPGQQPATTSSPNSKHQHQHLQQQNAIAEHSHFQRRGWEAVWNLEGEPRFFSPDKVQHWRTLVDNYICNGILPLKYPADEVVQLICKAETNSFGLYPGVTGQYPVDANTTRGDYYGGGLWPTAAMFNHACCPNITHQVDDFGRRTFRAGRDIDVGEECCISYFDLAEYPVYGARKQAIFESWSFACDCKRCDEDLAMADDFMAMDFGLDL
ncbi:SET domain-containing protein [Sarocladium implicatum]|nr:SET domain-containing protein [Sarocladium implicatum]